MLTMPAEGYWEPFVRLDQPEWITDPRFADTETRTEHGPELMILCDEILATAESHTWAERLDAAGMVWGLYTKPR